MTRRLAPLLCLALGACVPQLKYAPNPPAADTPKVTAPVFFDGFEDQSVLETLPPGSPNWAHYSLTKEGSKNLSVPRLEPRTIGLHFVEELKASGLFSSAEYLTAGDKPAKEGILVHASVHRAFLVASSPERPLTLEFSVDAVSWPQERKLLAKRFRYHYPDIGVSGPGLMGGGWHDKVVGRLRDAFGKLAAELARSLAGEAQDGAAGPGAPPKQESAEAILKRAGSGE